MRFVNKICVAAALLAVGSSVQAQATGSTVATVRELDGQLQLLDRKKKLATAQADIAKVTTALAATSAPPIAPTSTTTLAKPMPDRVRAKPTEASAFAVHSIYGIGENLTAEVSLNGVPFTFTPNARIQGGWRLITVTPERLVFTPIQSNNTADKSGSKVTVMASLVPLTAAAPTRLAPPPAGLVAATAGGPLPGVYPTSLTPPQIADLVPPPPNLAPR